MINIGITSLGSCYPIYSYKAGGLKDFYSYHRVFSYYAYAYAYAYVTQQNLCLN